jgi:hypothetical protein
MQQQSSSPTVDMPASGAPPITGTTPSDPLRTLQELAINKVQQDDAFWQPLNSGGIP